MKKLTFLLASLCLTLLINAAENSGNQRKTYNFNSDWKLHIGDFQNLQEVIQPEAPSPVERSGFWKSVTLPYAFNEDEAFKLHIEQLTDTVVWYRKHFRVKELRGKMLTP